VSELSLNVLPAPELLNAAGPAPLRARPDAGPPPATGAANPFAALLAGVLGGTQGLTRTPAVPGPAPGFAELAADAATTEGTPALPAGTVATPLALASLPAGNGLPVAGNGLPPGAGTDAMLAPRTAPPGAPHPEGPASPPPPRSNVSLAELALTKPVDPVTQPVAELPTAPADGARQAAALTLAGRAAAGGGNPPGETAARTPVASGFLATAPATGAIAESLAPAAFPARQPPVTGPDTGRVPLLTGAMPAGAGSELLAGQLAAFAAAPDAAAAITTSTAGLAGNAPADAGSAGLLSRLGNPGLPPLQPLGESGAFAGGLADRLLTLGGPGAHSARLKLHPEHLGELDVEITMEDGTAQVWFGTTTTQARDAIEGSLPRLRELFAEQGIQLTRTQVDAGSGQPGSPGYGQERRMTGGAAPWSDAPAWQATRPGAAVEPAGMATGRSARLLDVWA
jgi:flagellar hook-length control protein FliK